MSSVPAHRAIASTGRHSTFLGLEPREWIAYLSFAAALAHAILLRQTFAEWWEAGVFFVALMIGEAAVGYLVLKNVRPALVALFGVWLNVGTVLTYLVSRIWGFDFAPDRGPHGTDVGPGRPILPYTIELVGTFDYFVLVVEVVTILLLVGRLPVSWRRRSSNVLVVAALGLLWAAVATS